MGLTTTDNCTGVMTGTRSDPLTYIKGGTHVIQWSFDDGNGNVTLVDQNVVIKDLTKPVAPLLADVNGECSATAPVPTTTDKIGRAMSRARGEMLVDNMSVKNEIHWSFDDGHGNI